MSDKSDQTPLKLAQSHIHDLVGAGSSEYRVFNLLETTEQPPEESATIRSILIKIIEINISGEFKQGEAICHTAGKLFEKENQDRVLLFKCWLGCIEKADPSRSSIKSLFSNFSSMIDGLPEAAREYLDFLPVLFEFYKKDALKIIPKLADTVKNEIPTAKANDFFELLKAYISNVTFKVFTALIPVVSFITRKDTQFKEEFEKLCSPDILEEDPDVDKFLKSLGDAVENFPTKYEESFFRLNLVIASESFSSACYVAKNLNEKIRNLDTKFHGEYIEVFIQIMDKVGIRMINFCLNTLPNLFSTKELEVVRRYIDTLLTISSNYGPYAGFCFVQRETSTSKEFLKNINHDIEK